MVDDDSFPTEIVAVLVDEPRVFKPTLTVKLKVLMLLPAVFEIAVELVQVMTCGEAEFELQVQFAAFVPLITTAPTDPPLNVIPNGRVSVKVIVPEVGTEPLLVAVNV